MKQFSQSKILVILALGILCLVTGIFFSIYFASGNTESFPLLPSIVILAGTVCVYLAMTFFKDTMLLYAGLVCWTVGISLLLTHTNILPYTQKQMWPVILIICGFFLFPSGYFRYRKARTTYIFPGTLMITLGFFFTLFSFKIIEVSFAEFISKWWPLFLIFIGIILVAVFLISQRYQALFPYINENSTDLAMDDGVTEED